MKRRIIRNAATFQKIGSYGMGKNGEQLANAVMRCAEAMRFPCVLSVESVMQKADESTSSSPSTLHYASAL